MADTDLAQAVEATNDTTMFDLQFRLMGQRIALCHGKNDIAAFERVMIGIRNWKQAVSGGQ